MNKLKFKLVSDLKTLIDSETSYFIKDNIMNFKIDDDIYEYHMDNNILKKKNKESIITMDFSNYIIIIEVIVNNLMFNMEITEYNIQVDDNKITIKYSYLGEKLITNNIFIEY